MAAVTTPPAAAGGAGGGGDDGTSSPPSAEHLGMGVVILRGALDEGQQRGLLRQVLGLGLLAGDVEEWGAAKSGMLLEPTRRYVQVGTRLWFPSLPLSPSLFEFTLDQK